MVRCCVSWASFLNNLVGRRCGRVKLIKKGATYPASGPLQKPSCHTELTIWGEVTADVRCCAYEVSCKWHHSVPKMKNLELVQYENYARPVVKKTGSMSVFDKQKHVKRSQLVPLSSLIMCSQPRTFQSCMVSCRLKIPRAS